LNPPPPWPGVSPYRSRPVSGRGASLRTISGKRTVARAYVYVGRGNDGGPGFELVLEAALQATGLLLLGTLGAIAVGRDRNVAGVQLLRDEPLTPFQRCHTVRR
jgi:hypothetical protein